MADNNILSGVKSAVGRAVSNFGEGLRQPLEAGRASIRGADSQRVLAEAQGLMQAGRIQEALRLMGKNLESIKSDPGFQQQVLESKPQLTPSEQTSRLGANTSFGKLQLDAAPQPIGQGDINIVGDQGGGFSQQLLTRNPLSGEIGQQDLPGTPVPRQTLGNVDPATLTTSSQGKQQERILDSSTRLNNFMDIKKKFEPAFVTAIGRFRGELSKTLEKVFNVSPGNFEAKLNDLGITKKEDRNFLKRFSTFNRQAMQTLNEEIKRITGVAVRAGEEGRIVASTIDPRKDSPTTFKSKLDDLIRLESEMISRAQIAIKFGVNVFGKDGNIKQTSELTPRERQVIQSIDLNSREVQDMADRMSPRKDIQVPIIIENDAGDRKQSTDGGKTWQTIN